MHGKCVRQQNVRQDNIMDRAGILPLNLYETDTVLKPVNVNLLIGVERVPSHCQKFGSKWRTRVRIESLMAAKSCKEMYGISTKIQNTTTKSHNIP